MALPFVLAVSLLPTMAESTERIQEIEECICQFPSLEVACLNREFVGKHLDWMHKVGESVPTHRRQVLAAHLADAQQLYDAWFWLYYAKTNLKYAKSNLASEGPPSLKNHLKEARDSIEKLGEILGKEAFAAGRMPPPVPIWRFQWVD